MLNYGEISEVLENLEKEYNELRKSKSSHRNKVGSIGMFVIRRLRKDFRMKIIKKFSKGSES